MLDMERFLVENSINIFQVKGSQSMVAWTKILPIEFTAGIVGQFGVKAESADYAAVFNQTISSEGLQEGTSPTLVSHSCHRFDPLLVKLATGMSKVEHVPRTHEALNANICREFLQHIRARAV